MSNLKNNRIKFGELMQNEAAAEIIRNAFPQLADGKLVRMAWNMSLEKVVKFASGYVSEKQLSEVLAQLEKI